MQKERVLYCGNRPHILVGKKGEVRAMEPYFFATLSQLEILLLTFKGFSISEISNILGTTSGNIRNKNTFLFKHNDKNRFDIMKVADELSLLSTVVIRGILSCMDPKEIKQNIPIIKSMEKAINEKKDVPTYGIFPKRNKTPLPVILGTFVPSQI